MRVNPDVVAEFFDDFLVCFKNDVDTTRYNVSAHFPHLLQNQRMVSFACNRGWVEVSHVFQYLVVDIKETLPG
jgi:hypothetical protein